MPSREDEYWAAKKEPRGRGLCPRCGSSNLSYNEKFQTWRCNKCEHSFPTPSYGPGRDFGEEPRRLGETSGRLKSDEVSSANPAPPGKAWFGNEYYDSKIRKWRKPVHNSLAMKKTFLILLAFACLVFTGWAGFLLYDGKVTLLEGGIIIALGAGVLIWDISAIRRHRVGAWTLVSLFLIVALIGSTVSAFAGIEPLESYKNTVVDEVSTVVHNIRLNLFPTDEEIQVEAFNLINEERVENGLEVLVSDMLLTNLAIEHCQYMKDVGECNHDGFNSRADVVLGSGHFIVGENVAEGYGSATSLVSGWLSSPGHRENILNPSFRHTGLSYIDGYACQIFSD